MSSGPGAWWERLAALALPARQREAVVADLCEEALVSATNLGATWVARQAVVIAARVHLEAWRDAADLWRLAGLLAAAVALWCVVPAAATTMQSGAALFTTAPWAGALAALWPAGHLAAALAAGLLLGRVPLAGEHLDPARWHLAALLAVAAIARDGWGAAAMLLGAVWLADLSRCGAKEGSGLAFCLPHQPSGPATQVGEAKGKT